MAREADEDIFANENLGASTDAQQMRVWYTRPRLKAKTLLSAMNKATDRGGERSTGVSKLPMSVRLLRRSLCSSAGEE
jgi:hypothetical protein